MLSLVIGFFYRELSTFPSCVEWFLRLYIVMLFLIVQLVFILLEQSRHTNLVFDQFLYILGGFITCHSTY